MAKPNFIVMHYADFSYEIYKTLLPCIDLVFVKTGGEEDNAYRVWQPDQTREHYNTITEYFSAKAAAKILKDWSSNEPAE